METSADTQLYASLPAANHTMCLLPSLGGLKITLCQFYALFPWRGRLTWPHQGQGDKGDVQTQRVPHIHVWQPATGQQHEAVMPSVGWPEMVRNLGGTVSATHSKRPYPMGSRRIGCRAEPCLQGHAGKQEGTVNVFQFTYPPYI